VKNTKNNKKTFKKRNYKKRNKRRSIIPTTPPNSTLVRLNYSENLTLSTSLGSIGSYVFRTNDLFDPNYTGTGHQPYFRDQMFALYQYGRVLSMKITFTLITGNSIDPLFVVVGPIQSGTADTDMQTGSERKGSKETYMNGQAIKKLSCASSCDYYFGAKKGTTILSAAYLQASTASLNNGSVMWYQILFTALNAASVTLNFKVDISMITRFEQPRQQTSS